MRPYKTTHQGKQVSFACLHWRSFPPVEAYLPESADELRASGAITDVQRQRVQVWEKTCGLLRMDDDKCRTCPHVRWVEVRQAAAPTMVSLDGRSRTPIVDKTFIAALPANRVNFAATTRPRGTRHAKRNAAWVENKERSDG
jgi:hypothetical protein